MKRVAFVLSCLLFLACNNGKLPAGAVAGTPAIQRDTHPLPPKIFANRLAPVDLSPLDISYFPADYPVRRMTGDVRRGPLARVIYSRPHKSGRELFGTLIRFGEPWRLGANESSEIELFEPALIQRQQVPRGRYILYCIPNATEWVIVFNTNTYSWGLKQDSARDAFRFTVPVLKSQQPLEYFTMVFEGNKQGAELVVAWDELMVRLPIQFKD